MGGPFDLRLLETLTRQRLAWWAASDPRVSARNLARELGVDRSTVSARLRQWTGSGFLVGREFMPNPALFDGAFSACRVTAASALQKPETMAALADADGVVAVLDAMGTDLVVVVAHAGAGLPERRTRALSRLPGVTHVGHAGRFPVPPPAREGTAKDWQLLRALRTHPKIAPDALADEFGVSTRTIRRRYADLLESGVGWCVTVFDWARYPNAFAGALLVGLHAGASRSAVMDELRKLLPTFVEYPSLRALTWPHDGPVVQILVPLDRVARVEEVQHAALGVPGVAAVDLTFPHRLHFVGAWAEERLESALARA